VRKQRPGDSDAYLALIRRLPSCVSGEAPPSVPHHLRCVKGRGVGMKAEDRWAVPLTPVEHTQGTYCVHTVGAREEERWFRDHGVSDIKALAEALWEARNDFTRMLLIVRGMV
jgi:hypothetical protein